MRRITLTVTFTDANGASREETKTIESSYDATLADEHRLAHIVGAELSVAVGEQAQPEHNATALKWLEFPNRTSPSQEAVYVLGRLRVQIQSVKQYAEFIRRHMER